MADAFAPSPFPPIAPRKTFPPPTLEDFKASRQVQITGGAVTPPSPSDNLWHDNLFWDGQQYWDE
jgi:hypothetical protein